MVKAVCFDGNSRSKSFKNRIMHEHKKPPLNDGFLRRQDDGYKVKQIVLPTLVLPQLFQVVPKLD